MQASGGPPSKPRANPGPPRPDLHFEPGRPPPQFVDERLNLSNYVTSKFLSYLNYCELKFRTSNSFSIYR